MKKKKTRIPIEDLEKTFHEPNRLSIMSALCAASDGLLFTELKNTCDLTDGNLNRHLKVLRDAKAIKVRKSFVDDKPATTVYISKSGLNQFSKYLSALSEVLVAAKKALPNEKKAATGSIGRRVNA